MKPRSVCSATVFSPRTLTLALGCLLTAAGAQAQDKIRIGFITDMSGLYADVDGKGGALAVQMAVDDFGGKLLGKPIEVLTADHQNKADIAASKAREWFDTQGMNMLIGGTTSSAGLAMGKVADEKKKVYIINGAGTSAVTTALNRQLMWKMAGAQNPEDALALDIECIKYMAASADIREGAAAFVEKRSAQFQLKPSKDMPPFYPWWGQKAAE